MLFIDTQAHRAPDGSHIFIGWRLKAARPESCFCTQLFVSEHQHLCYGPVKWAQSCSSAILSGIPGWEGQSALRIATKMMCRVWCSRLCKASDGLAFIILHELCAIKWPTFQHVHRMRAYTGTNFVIEYVRQKYGQSVWKLHNIDRCNTRWVNQTRTSCNVNSCS